MEKRNVIFLILLFSTLIPLTSAYTFCENTTLKSNLEIKEILYQKQADESTWDWGPTENLTIEVTVENKNFTTRNFDIELFLLDEDLDIEKFTSNTADIIKTISLDKDQTQTLNFSFQLKQGISGTYSLHAKLTDSENESICTNLEAASTGDEVTIEIKPEEKIIIVRNINGPTSASPGSQVEYIVEVINLGNIEEDRVLVIVYNNNFNIREEREIINLAVDESKNVTFNFTIPKNASQQEEVILFSTEYSYQNKTGFYYQFSEKNKIFLLQIETLNNQTENITKSQVENITENKTALPVTTKTTEDESKTSYLWIIIVISLVLIMAAIFFFLRYKGAPKIQTPSVIPTSAASDYVKSIQNKTTPTSPSTPPSKPS